MCGWLQLCKDMYIGGRFYGFPSITLYLYIFLSLVVMLSFKWWLKQIQIQPPSDLGQVCL